MTNVQQHIGSIALVVKDYDDAIEFYTQKLNFELVEDTDLEDGKRWVLISPPNSNGAGSNGTNSNGTNSSRTNLLLAKATTPEQISAIGNQTGGRVFLFLYTDDFWRDYNLMLFKGVIFNGEPRVEPYGTVAVFEDLYGTKWDLLQLNNQ
ncbi:VOC family protein [Pseudoalteromonas sp. NZS100_1]|uniref:VOC family protein n=1 Tax=Pseudoalteromonas sp. NZS100_1 TaxID=2792073 RepID=UPI0018CE0C87|nr:VOC family protein [Pseudoalteromonas sp. NZS100_1]MBH0012102.1 VOC family protein [Pseudoalteromonas sp. NZS100_1]